jgi:hypothetical protein
VGVQATDAASYIATAVAEIKALASKFPAIETLKEKVRNKYRIRHVKRNRMYLITGSHVGE